MEEAEKISKTEIEKSNFSGNTTNIIITNNTNNTNNTNTNTNTSIKKLKPRHQMFSQCIAIGLTGVEAYAKAFGKQLPQQEEVCRKGASRLLTRTDIQEEVKRLQKLQLQQYEANQRKVDELHEQAIERLRKIIESEPKGILTPSAQIQAIREVLDRTQPKPRCAISANFQYNFKPQELQELKRIHQENMERRRRLGLLPPTEGRQEAEEGEFMEKDRQEWENENTIEGREGVGEGDGK